MSDFIDGGLNVLALIFFILCAIILIYIYVRTRTIFHMLMMSFVISIMLYAIGNITDKFSLWAYGDGFGEAFAIFTCALGIVAAIMSILENQMESIRIKAIKDSKAKDKIIKASLFPLNKNISTIICLKT